MTQAAVSYKRHRFPPAVIAHVVWLYFRFPLSLRLVEEMLLERGVVEGWLSGFSREKLPLVQPFDNVVSKAIAVGRVLGCKRRVRATLFQPLKRA